MGRGHHYITPVCTLRENRRADGDVDADRADATSIQALHEVSFGPNHLDPTGRLDLGDLSTSSVASHDTV